MLHFNNHLANHFAVAHIVVCIL